MLEFDPYVLDLHSLTRLTPPSGLIVEDCFKFRFGLIVRQWW